MSDFVFANGVSGLYYIWHIDNTFVYFQYPLDDRLEYLYLNFGYNELDLDWYYENEELIFAIARTLVAHTTPSPTPDTSIPEPAPQQPVHIEFTSHDFNARGIRGNIEVPLAWRYEVGFDGMTTFHGEGSGGPITLWIGASELLDLERALRAASSYEEFVFRDGHVGYMAHYPDSVSWMRDEQVSFSVHHMGDISMFTRNESLIMSIAETFRH